MMLLASLSLYDGIPRRLVLIRKYRCNSVATLTGAEAGAFIADPDAKSSPHPKELINLFKK
jgi:hypothetical protein